MSSYLLHRVDCWRVTDVSKGS